MLPMMLQESEARRLTTFFPFDLNTRIRRATLTQTTIVDPKRNTCLFVLYISMIISVFIFLLYFFHIRAILSWRIYGLHIISGSQRQLKRRKQAR